MRDAAAAAKLEDSCIGGVAGGDGEGEAGRLPAALDSDEVVDTAFDMRRNGGSGVCERGVSATGVMASTDPLLPLGERDALRLAATAAIGAAGGGGGGVGAIILLGTGGGEGR